MSTRRGIGSHRHGGPIRTALWLGAAACAIAPAARADGVPSATFSLVRLAGADRCPDASVVRAEIEHRVGRPLFAAQGTLAVELALGPVGNASSSAWRAQVFLRGADGSLVGQRELATTSPDCTELAHAAALAIAVALDPDAVLRQAGAPSSPPTPSRTEGSSAAPVAPPPTPPPPSPPPVAAASPPPASSAPPDRLRAPAAPRVRRRARPPRTAVSLGAYAGGAIGWFPSVAPMLGIVTTIAPSHGPAWRIGSWYAPESRSASVAMGQIGMRLFALSVDACPALLRSERMTFSVCGGTTIGVETATGLGFSWNTTADQVYWDVDAGAEYRLNLGPVYLSAALDVGVPVIHTGWTVDGVGTVFEGPYVNVRGSIGVGLSFR